MLEFPLQLQPENGITVEGKQRLCSDSFNALAKLNLEETFKTNRTLLYLRLVINRK